MGILKESRTHKTDREEQQRKHFLIHNGARLKKGEEKPGGTNDDEYLLMGVPLAHHAPGLRAPSPHRYLDIGPVLQEL